MGLSCFCTYKSNMRRLMSNSSWNMSDEVPHFCWPYSYPVSFFIYGILCPSIAFLTLILNSLVIAVFMKKKMRSPTTVLLIGLAIGDILAGNVILPSYIYVYGMGKLKPLPFPMCIFYDYGAIFASIFHQSSVWITMTLGVQRYVVVAYPIQGRRFCTIKKSIYAVVAIYLASMLMYSITFFSTWYKRAEIDGKNVCLCDDNEDISDFAEQIINISRCVFGQVLPCLVLTLTTILLVRRLEIEKSQMRTIRAIENNEREKRDFRRIQRTSQMVLLIVVSFLVAEIPTGIFFAVRSIDVTAISGDTALKLATCMNVLVYIVNHINFWIYITMSQQFRNYIKRILCIDVLIWNKNSHSRYIKANSSKATFAS